MEAPSIQQRCRLLQPVIVLALRLLTIGKAYAEPAQTFNLILRLILRGGTLYDGSRRTPVPGDVGIAGDTFAAVGDLATAQVKRNIEELIELSKVAAEYDRLYISHMPSEGNLLLEAVNELFRVAREANLPTEIYHRKAASRDNWGNLAAVIKAEKDRHGPGYRGWQLCGVCLLPDE